MTAIKNYYNMLGSIPLTSKSFPFHTPLDDSRGVIRINSTTEFIEANRGITTIISSYNTGTPDVYLKSVSGKFNNNDASGEDKPSQAENKFPVLSIGELSINNSSTLELTYNKLIQDKYNENDKYFKSNFGYSYFTKNTSYANNVRSGYAITQNTKEENKARILFGSILNNRFYFNSELADEYKDYKQISIGSSNSGAASFNNVILADNTDLSDIIRVAKEDNAKKAILTTETKPIKINEKELNAESIIEKLGLFIDATSFATKASKNKFCIKKIIDNKDNLKYKVYAKDGLKESKTDIIDSDCLFFIKSNCKIVELVENKTASGVNITLISKGSGTDSKPCNFRLTCNEFIEGQEA